MAGGQTIVAHIIVGRKQEPYLAAVLESIAGVCDYAIINDNSGEGESVNATVAARSQLASTRRLQLVHSSFTGFASARNACIEATPAPLRQGWALVLDADEVHGSEIADMAALLRTLPQSIDAVDGYSRHFVGSFDWWIAVERRKCFFRLSEGRRWHGEIHEQLLPLGTQIVLPALWFHYGHVVTPQAEVEKSLLYASLGAGEAPPEEVLPIVTPHMVWSKLLRRANRFRGSHPAAALSTIALLRKERAAIFSEVDAVVREQTSADRVRNALYRLNVSRLLAWRRFEARARWHWPPSGSRTRQLGSP